MNLYNLVERWVKATPDSVAVSSNGVFLSYDHLNEQVTRLASFLSEAFPAAAVAVMLSRSTSSLTALLAIIKAGCVYVPIDPEMPVVRLEYILQDAQVACILTDTAMEKKLPKTSIPTVTRRGDAWNFPVRCVSPSSGEKSTIPTPSARDHSAYIMYTSGSTGSPKGVIVGRQALLTFLNSITATIDFARTEVLLAVTRTTFDISLLELLVPVTTGGHTVIATENEITDSAALGGLIHKQKVRTVQATPSYLTWLSEHHRDALKDLRVLVGGEPLSSDLARKLLQPAREVWNLYGPTEATIWATVRRVIEADIDERTPRIVNIGRALPDYRTYILSEEMKPVLPGAVGELYIGGPAVATGYLNRQDLTTAAFFKDVSDPSCRMYKTGDLVRKRGDGNLDFLGRVDRQVKIRGMRVELEEIEAHLRQLKDIYDAVVVYRNTERATSRLIGYVLSRESHEFDNSAIREQLRHTLPEHMVPSSIVQMVSFPLNAHGKLDRDALPDPDQISLASPGEVVHDSFDGQRDLRAIFASTLGVADVKPEDNFFDLGGHSLTAMRIVNRVRVELGAEIPVSLLFLADSLEEIFREVAKSADSRLAAH